jgi:hypothetical protein
LAVEGASGAPSDMEIAPGGREERTISADGPEKVTVRLDAGDVGRSIVSARLTTMPSP